MYYQKLRGVLRHATAPSCRHPTSSLVPLQYTDTPPDTGTVEAVGKGISSHAWAVAIYNIPELASYWLTFGGNIYIRPCSKKTRVVVLFIAKSCYTCVRETHGRPCEYKCR